jgi:hypothetical protein
MAKRILTISPRQHARQAVRLREIARVAPRAWRALDRFIASHWSQRACLHTAVVKKGRR